MHESPRSPSGETWLNRHAIFVSVTLIWFSCECIGFPPVGGSEVIKPPEGYQKKYLSARFLRAACLGRSLSHVPLASDLLVIPSCRSPILMFIPMTYCLDFPPVHLRMSRQLTHRLAEGQPPVLGQPLKPLPLLKIFPLVGFKEQISKLDIFYCFFFFQGSQPNGRPSRAFGKRWHPR